MKGVGRTRAQEEREAIEGGVAGLRGLRRGVSTKVALGLLVSAVLAYVAGSVPAVRDLLFELRHDRRTIAEFSPTPAGC